MHVFSFPVTIMKEMTEKTIYPGRIKTSCLAVPHWLFLKHPRLNLFFELENLFFEKNSKKD